MHRAERPEACYEESLCCIVIFSMDSETEGGGCPCVVQVRAIYGDIAQDKLRNGPNGLGGVL